LNYLSFPEHIRSNDVVFLGDSLTESFDLQKHFGRNDLHNRGMSGDLTDHVLYRLEEITNAKPAKVFLMIGINDIYQGSEPGIILANIERIINEFLQKAPATCLLVQSILPLNRHKLFIEKSVNTKIYQINLRLKSICESKNLAFIDIHADFLNNEGEMDEKYTYDGVHLSEAGYILWAELIQSYLG
jgi:lysophospholipase L1-like esterase